VQIANSYTGITGDTSLNEAGDRKHGDYDFWVIKPSTNNNFVWTQVSRFQINVNNKNTEFVKNNIKQEHLTHAYGHDMTTYFSVHLLITDYKLRAPRDALIAESVDKKDLGKAFGFHRASDTVGAVIGSFLGFVFLTVITGNASEIYRLIFVISAIPAVISVIIAEVFVIEKKKPHITARKSREITDQDQLEQEVR